MDVQQLQSMFKDHQLYHSDLQIDNFIVSRAGGLTDYGQYKQALRELHSRYRSLKDLYTSRALLNIDVAELEADLEDYKQSSNLSKASCFRKARQQINLTKKKMDFEDLELNIKETEREFNRFYALANALKQKLGELTPERVAQLDLDMWVDKLEGMAALEYICSGRLAQNTVELVQSMPQAQRLKFLNQIGSPDGIETLKKKFLTADYKLPKISALQSCDDVPKLMAETLQRKGASNDDTLQRSGSDQCLSTGIRSETRLDL